MMPFSTKDIADHIRSAERLASQAERQAVFFQRQAEIQIERAARFRAEAGAWSRLETTPQRSGDLAEGGGA